MLLFVVLFSLKANATQLSGNYTIDAAGTASATVFKNFNSFVTYLTSSSARLDGGPANSGTFGMSGDVNVTVKNGTYNEQFSIPGTYANAGVYKLTFWGQSRAGTIITFAASVSGAWHTVQLNGAKNVEFRNMTITGTGTTYCATVHLLNNHSDNAFRNCQINSPSTTTTIVNPFVSNGSSTSATTGAAGARLTIDSCTITNGYYGLVMYGSSSAACQMDHRVTNCTLSGAYWASIYNSNNYNYLFQNNIITQTTSSSTSSYGIYLSSSNGTSSGTPAPTFSRNGFKGRIINNTISNIGLYSIYMTSANGQAALHNEIIGNLFYGNQRNTSGTNAIYVSSGNYWNMFHNTFASSYTSANTSYGALRIVSTTGDSIMNNNFINTGSGYGLNITLASVTSSVIDGNNFYNFTGGTSQSNVIYNASTSIAYSGSQVNAAGVGSNNSNMSQGWVSMTNLTPLNPCVNAPYTLTQLRMTTAPYSAGPNAVTRNSTAPDFGANEMNVSANDLAVLGFTSPSVPVVSGTQTLTVVVRNAGGNTITDFTLAYQVNGGSAVTQTFSGRSIAACSYDTVSFTTTWPLTAGCATVQAYVVDVNSTFDPNSANDLYSTSFGISLMGGTAYTINSSLAASSTNFTSFASALSALTCGGVAGTGDVVFTVTGTYNEQITVPAIPGTTASRRVIFRGIDSTTSQITFAGTVSNPHTVKITNASYVNFEQMSIRGTSATTAYPLQFAGNATGIIVKKCNIVAPSLSTYAHVAVLFSSATSYSIGSSGVSCTDITIDSNVIIGGTDVINIASAGTTLATSNKDIKIRYNQLLNPVGGLGYGYIATSGGSIYGLDFSNNVMDCQITSGTYYAYYGTYFTSLGSIAGYKHKINNNIMGGRISSGYAFYFTTAMAGNASGSTLRDNWNEFNGNVVKGGLPVALTYYFYSSSAGGMNRWKMYHNTFYQDNSSTSSYTAYIASTATDSIDILNNDFIANGGLPLFTSTALSAGSRINYNNYYQLNSSTNLISYGGTVYTTSNYNTLPIGGNSFNVNQGWTSAQNLTISNPCVNGLNVGITTDVTGFARSSTPDVGAYEVTSITANDASIAGFVTPTNPASLGSNTVKVILKNMGASNLTSASVYYAFNGSLIGIATVTGINLAPCDTMHYTFATPFTLTSGCNTLTAFTSLPNGVADGNSGNDSLTISVGGALSGNYTINASSPTGGSNFQTFNEALQALACTGVGTGGITFTVSGTFNEQVDFTPIGGASASNPVRFVGVDTNTAILQSNFTTAPTFYSIVRFNAGTKWITIQNMTIRALGTYAYGVLFNGGDSNTVRGCNIWVPVGTSTTQIPIVFSGSSTSYLSAYTGGKNYVDSCVLTNGYLGLSTYGSNTSFATLAKGQIVTNNTIVNPYTYGLYTPYCRGGYYANNTVTMRTIANGGSTTNNGWYWYYNSNDGNDTLLAINNKFSGWGTYGIYVYGLGKISYLVTNNIPITLIGNEVTGTGVSTGTNYGLYTYASRARIWNNTVYNQNNSTTSYSYYNGSGSTADTLDIRNNTFIKNTSSVTQSPYFSTVSPTNGSVINYNNYWNMAGTVGDTVYAYRLGGTPSGNLGVVNYKTAQGAGLNSTSIDQSWASASDLTPSNGCANAVILTSLAGRNGVTRTAAPDMGAYEVPSFALDTRADALITPTTPATAGSNMIAVRVRNNGSSTITSVTVNYTINGGSVNSQTFGGLSLLACDTVTLFFSSAATLPTGCTAFKVYTSNPNGGADQNPSNDTLSTSVGVALAGTYTIGGVSPDYSTISAAIAALNCSGVSAPVTFNIRTGTYNERLTFTAISTAAASRSITFQSQAGNRDSVIVSFAASTSSNVVSLSGSAYLTLKDLTVSNTGGNSSSRAIELSGSPNVITFDNVRTLNVTGSSTLYGFYANSALMDSVTIKNSSIEGGYYGVYFNGNSTTYDSYTTIQGNTYKNIYYYGNYLYYQGGVLFTGNTVSNFINTFNYGIYSYYWNALAGRKNEISKNNIYVKGGYAAYLNYINYNISGALPRGIVANNMFACGSSSNASTAGGLYLYYPAYTDVFHNSVRVEGTTTSYGLYFYNASTSYPANRMRNNIFANFSNNSGAYAAYYSSTTLSSVFTTDSNDIYNNGPLANHIYWNGTIYSSNSAFNTAVAGMEANSISRNPLYMSASNLHCQALANDSIGSLASVWSTLGLTTDIDGQLRCPTGGCPGSGTAPDLGADEFAPVANDAGVASIVSSGFCPGSNNIQVTYRNFSGTTALTSGTIEWAVATNGGPFVAQTPYTMSGSLAASATSALTTIGSYTFTLGNNYQLKAWTSSPNGASDEDNTNDTLLSTGFVTSMSGTFTVGGASPDYATLTLAIADLSTKGICGPVTLNVRQGTYTDKINMSALTGSSAVNRLTIQSDPANTSNPVWDIPTSSSSTANYGFQLNGVDYVTLKKLNITRSGTNSYGYGIYFIGGNVGIRIDSCNITTANTGTSGQAGIYKSTSSSDSLYDFRLTNSSITGGYYGFYNYGASTGASRLVDIDSNTFTGQYYYGLYNVYPLGIRVRYNTFNANATSNTFHYTCYNSSGGFDSLSGRGRSIYSNNTINGYNGSTITNYGLYFTSCTNGIEVSNNTINTGYSAIYLTACYGDTTNSANYATRRNRIYNNNLIQTGYTNYTQNFVYITNSQGTDFDHNNINVVGSVPGGGFYPTAATFAGPNRYNNVRNNNFMGTSGAIPVFMMSLADSIVGNNYYTTTAGFDIGVRASTTGTSVGLYSKAQFDTLVAFTDTPSFNVDAGYYSNTNLHVTNQVLNNAVPQIWYINTDIDGDVRSGGIVDVGSDEFVPSPYDLAVTGSPYPNFAGGCSGSGADSIVITIRNYGTGTINFAAGDSLVVTTSGVNPQSYNYSLTGSLAAGASQNVVVTNSYNTSIAGMHYFNATCYLNSVTDGFAGNNSMATDSVYRPASVTVTNVSPYNQGYEADITTSWLNYGGTKNWIRRTGAGATTTTGPSGATHGSYYLATPNTSVIVSDSFVIQTPCMDLSALGCGVATFRYYMYGANIGTLRLDVSTDGGQTWNWAWTKSGQQQTARGQAWGSAIVDLAAYSTATTSFRFVYGNLPGTSTMEVAIDTFRVATSATVTASTTASATSGTTCNVFTFTDVTTPASASRKWKVTGGPYTLQGGTSLTDSIVKFSFGSSGSYVVMLDTVTTVCGSSAYSGGAKVISVAVPAGTPGTWTGAQDTSWNNACNWADGNVPSSGANIVIPAGVSNNPGVNAPVYVGNFTLGVGETINLNSTIYISGNANVSGMIQGAGTISMAGTSAQDINAPYMPSTALGLTNAQSNTNSVFSGTSNGLVFTFTKNGRIDSVSMRNSGATVDGTIELRNSSNITLYSKSVTGLAPSTWNKEYLGWDLAAGTGYRLVFITPGTAGVGYSCATGITYPMAINGWVSITSGWNSGATTTANYYHFFDIKVSSGTTLANLAIENSTTNVTVSDDAGVQTLALNMAGNNYLRSSGSIDQDNLTNYKTIYVENGTASAVTRSSGTDSTNFYQGVIRRKVSAGETGTYLFPVGFYNANGDTTDRRNGKAKGFFSPFALNFTTASSTTGYLTGSYYDYDPTWYNGNIRNKDTVGYGQYNLWDTTGGGHVDVKANALWRCDNSGLTNFVYDWEVGSMIFDSTGFVGDDLSSSPTLRLVKRDSWNTGNWTFQGSNASAGLLSAYTAKNAARRNGLTSFSSVSVAGNGERTTGEGLPVELVSFDAKKVDRTAALTWVTASEKNFARFVIERSANGVNFEEIGTRTAMGGTVKTTYNFTDVHPASGVNYYRLKMVDVDGKVAYSSVRSVTFSDAITSVVLLPNPFVANLGVELNVNKGGMARFTVMDMTGRMVMFSSNQSVKSGKNLIQLNQADDLAAGTYLLRIDFGGETIYTKVIKQN